MLWQCQPTRSASENRGLKNSKSNSLNAKLASNVLNEFVLELKFNSYSLKPVNKHFFNITVNIIFPKESKIPIGRSNINWLEFGKL